MSQIQIFQALPTLEGKVRDRGKGAQGKEVRRIQEMEAKHKTGDLGRGNLLTG